MPIPSPLEFSIDGEEGAHGQQARESTLSVQIVRITVSARNLCPPRQELGLVLVLETCLFLFSIIS